MRLSILNRPGAIPVQYLQRKNDMNTFKTLAIGAVALGAAALTTPAQAGDRHHHGHNNGRHWDGHRHGRVVYYSAPRTYYRPYYYDDYAYAPSYGYYRTYPRYYSSGPSISFAFGGHRHHGHWRR